MSAFPRYAALSGLLARCRSLWRGIRRRSTVEAEMLEEFRHHIDLRTADLIHTGLTEQDARRQAHLEFGPVETHRERARSSRGLGPIDQVRFSWVDVKLALRMLVKHPAMSVVAIFALAIGIPVGLAPMHLASAIEAPLPEDPGNRVRAIRYWHAPTTSFTSPSDYDLEVLGQELHSFDALGAARTVSYNVALSEGPAAPIRGAEVTSSTFDILATPPLMGRPLQRGDEAVGAPNVAVIGHDLWQSRFGADPDIVGKTLLVAQVPHTIVGVMPKGFYFPLLQQLWIPLRRDLHTEPGQGPGLVLFGHLAPGVDAEQAQAEVAAIGQRLAAEFPNARGELEAEVVPFAFSFLGISRDGLDAMPEFYFFQTLALLLLLVACANVAMLIFARTASRFEELAVRSALGGSRARIVSQIFVETLVLATVSAAVGLASCHWLLKQARAIFLARGATLPYWLDLGITQRAVVYALLLAVLSATAAGVAPALRITGKRILGAMRRAGAGRSGIRFGGITSGLVAADVAIAIAAVGFSLGLAERMVATAGSLELVGIPAEEYLAATLRLPTREPGARAGAVDRAAFRRRLAATQQALIERLENEPGVRGVALADALPRTDQRMRLVEVEGIDSPGGFRGRYMRTAVVDVDYFRALDQPILAGRDFDRGDVGEKVSAAIVNTTFVDQVLGGEDAIGRRLRLVNVGGDQDQPWIEIVGVVGHLGMNLVNPEGDHGVYLPAPPGGVYPMQLGIHTVGDPESFVPRLRELVDEVDPSAILSSPQRLSKVYQGDWYLTLLIAGGLGVLVAVLVVLAASGIYAMVSFSVAERTREIGIRNALGASRSRLVVTILRRSLWQIGCGALIGTPLAWRFYSGCTSDLAETTRGFSAPASSGAIFVRALLFGASVVLLVGLSSCLLPARRALRIQPSDALRSE